MTTYPTPLAQDHIESDDQTLTPKQAERRRRILAAVRKLVGDIGYASFSMRDVAAEAGVAHATLYNLYTNKDNLVLAALQDNIGRLTRIREENFTNTLEKYLGIVRVIVQDVVDGPHFAEAMTQLLFNASPSDDVVRVLMTNRIAHDRTSLLHMREEGLVADDIDVDVIARQLTGTYWSSMLMWMKGFTALHDVPKETIRAHKLVLGAVATTYGKEVLTQIPE